MKLESNTEKFLALKKLSELKAEYHKQNLKNQLTLYRQNKKTIRYFGKAAGAVQSILKLVKIFKS